MATITSTQVGGDVVITPTLVLDYGYDVTAGTVVHDPIAGGMPRVTLRPPASRGGTLTLLFVGRQAARDMEDVLAYAGKLHFQAPETGEDFHLVATGSHTVREVAGTTNWTVSVPFREVAP